LVIPGGLDLSLNSCYTADFQNRKLNAIFDTHVKMGELHVNYSSYWQQNAELGTNQGLSGFYFYQNYFTLRMDIAKISK